MQKAFWKMFALVFLVVATSFTGNVVFAKSTQLVSSSDPFFTQVSPILEAKCASCHTASTKFSLIPKGKMLKSLDLTDYLNGKVSHLPNSTWDRLQTVVQNGSMPPAPYTWLHRNAKLTEDDKKILLDWIQANRTAKATE